MAGGGSEANRDGIEPLPGYMYRQPSNYTLHAVLHHVYTIYCNAYHQLKTQSTIWFMYCSDSWIVSNLSFSWITMLNYAWSPPPVPTVECLSFTVWNDRSAQFVKRRLFFTFTCWECKWPLCFWLEEAGLPAWFVTSHKWFGSQSCSDIHCKQAWSKLPMREMEGMPFKGF